MIKFARRICSEKQGSGEHHRYWGFPYRIKAVQQGFLQADVETD